MAESLKETVPNSVLFISTWGEPGSEPYHWTKAPGLSYPQAINLLARQATDFEWLFMGSDDIVFHPGWYEKALEQASDRFDVIGTNDLGNPRVTAGLHSTHSLIRSSYLAKGTIDGEGLMWEGYGHNFADDELVETAKARGTFVHSPYSVVEHFHPAWEKAEMDATYRDHALNMDLFAEDKERFLRRRALWS